MGYELVDKKIEVMGEFKGGSVMPRIFKLEGRNYKVKKVHLAYQERDGKFMNYYYSAETEGGLYKLKFNNGSLIWEAVETWVE